MQLYILIDGLSEFLRSSPGDAFLDISIFEDAECWHLSDPKLLCNVFIVINIELIEAYTSLGIFLR